MSQQVRVGTHIGRIALAALLSVSLVATGLGPVFADTEAVGGTGPEETAVQSDDAAPESADSAGTTEGGAQEAADSGEKDAVNNEVNAQDAAAGTETDAAQDAEIPAEEAEEESAVNEEAAADAATEPDSAAQTEDAAAPAAELPDISTDKGYEVKLAYPGTDYTGAKLTPAVTVTYKDPEVAAGTPAAEPVTLKKDTDYTVAYKNNVNAGTATVTITGKKHDEDEGGYQGTVTKTFKINKVDIKKANTAKKVSVGGIKNKTYTGRKVTQDAKKLSVKVNGRTLKNGTDYTLSYANNKKIGTAKVTIKGKGNYTGSVVKTFKITSRLAKTLNWSGVRLSFKTSVQRDLPLGAGAGPRRAWVTGQEKSIKLNWTKASNRKAIDGYIILRREGNAKTYTQVAKVGKNTKQYVDKSASRKNRAYTYTIVGYKKTGSTIRISPACHWVSGVTTKSAKYNGYNAIINKKTATLQKGQSTKLTLTYKVPIHWGATFRWYSDNPKVATVSKNGTVKGVSTGTTKIRGRLPSGRDVVCTVTVLPAKYKKTSKGRWISYKNNRYYASPAGPIYTNRFFQVGNYWYYAGSTGAVTKSPIKRYGVTMTPNKYGAISKSQYQAYKAAEADAKAPYVLVDISDQRLYYMKEGKVLYSSSVVTGKNSTPTVIGTFRIYQKSRGTTLRGSNGDGTTYASYVRYWMPFYGGYGLHDADWRGSFGGSIYRYGGSHGCVNLPIPTARWVWEHTSVGTKVIVRR